jgi:GAF domain-containing protein
MQKTMSIQEAVDKVHDVAMRQSLNSLDDLSILVVDLAKGLVGAENGRLRFVDYTEKRLVPGTISGILAEKLDMTTRKIGECIVGKAAKKKKIQVVDDVQNDLCFKKFRRKIEKLAKTDSEWQKYYAGLLEIGSEIAVPIMAGKTLLGVLNVNASKGSFNKEHEELLSKFASEVALSFLNRRALILLALYKIENKMVSAFDIKEVAQSIAYGIRKMFKDCVPNIFLYNENNDKAINPFEFLTGAGASREETRLGKIKPRYDSDPSKAGRGIEAINKYRQGEDYFVVVENVQADPHASVSAKEKGVKTTCCIPLTFKGTVVGILYLHFFNRHFFTIEEKVNLKMFAIAAAFAIKNATVLPTYGELIGNGLIDQLATFKPIEKRISKPSLNGQIWIELERISTILKSSRGEEEISKSILDEVGKLCDILNLPQKFSKIFCNFQKNEAILYKLPYYRDHFVHSFHVFYLGYLILNGWWNNKVPFIKGDSEAAKDRVLRTWFMASILHDIAYPIEMTERWVPSFPKKVLGLDMEIRASFDWTPLLLKEENITHIEKITQNFLDPLNIAPDERFIKNIAFKNWFINQLLKVHDHGALSSLALLGLECSKDGVNCDYDAALIVLLHNYLKKQDSTIGALSLNSYPLAFLLAYCDSAQEWGRTQAPPFEELERLLDHSIKFGSLKIDSKQTAIVLSYNIEERCKKKGE